MWDGLIRAVWDLDEDGDDGASEDLPGSGDGWDGADPEVDDDTFRLPVGELTRWMLPLDFDEPFALSEAADAVAQDLCDVVAPIVGDHPLLIDDCYELTSQDWFDRLLVLRAIELVPQLRGHGVGAWASARSVKQLAPDSGTSILTKAAPLHREPFMRDDTDPHREFTPAEERAWRGAQQEIAAHWQQNLGLIPLPHNPAILIGTVDTAEGSLQAAVDSWA
ncbi:hypothetical protein [Geodermatophilus sp. URMC 62]|uniref:hypothetical protein n=1 Tax=Geodermatophilus sp. URMC 62 TaxID=3423414 RepID=UPI00406C0DB8